MTAPNGKKIMVSARVPKVLVARIDLAVRNTADPQVTNRSTAMAAAMRLWTDTEELYLKERLGGPKK